jgi:cold-inducible RNA-binding protein
MLLTPSMKNSPSNTVYISNLSYNRDRNGLRSLFNRYGKIKSIKLIVEPQTNQSRGMAFVEMETVEEATAAIEGLNQQLIDGRTVKANYAVPLRDELKTNKTGPAKKEKDLNFKDIQLAKKARNDAKRKKRPF